MAMAQKYGYGVMDLCSDLRVIGRGEKTSESWNCQTNVIKKKKKRETNTDDNVLKKKKHDCQIIVEKNQAHQMGLFQTLNEMCLFLKE